MNKSLLTNIVAVIFIIAGYLSPIFSDILLSIGFFVNNLLNIIILFFFNYNVYFYEFSYKYNFVLNEKFYLRIKIIHN